MQARIEKKETAMQEKLLDNMIKRGEGSAEKRIRSTVDGKENHTLNPYMTRYQNVDENITAVRQKSCPYQLVREDGQFKQENPTVSICILSAKGVTLPLTEEHT